MPEKQVKNGVIDTFVHTTEQYLTYPVEGRIQAVSYTHLDVYKRQLQ